MVKPSKKKTTMHRNRRLAKKNIRQAMKRVQTIEDSYSYTEKSFTELSRYLARGGTSLQARQEHDRLQKELDSLADELFISEQDVRVQIQENGSWEARLIGYWWRLRRLLS